MKNKRCLVCKLLALRHKPNVSTIPKVWLLISVLLKKRSYAMLNAKVKIKSRQDLPSITQLHLNNSNLLFVLWKISMWSSILVFCKLCSICLATIEIKFLNVTLMLLISKKLRDLLMIVSLSAWVTITQLVNVKLTSRLTKRSPSSRRTFPIWPLK